MGLKLGASLMSPSWSPLAVTACETVPPPGLCAPKRFFEQHILPAMIDLAGSCEALLETVLHRARRQPLGAIGPACGAGCLLGVLARLSQLAPGFTNFACRLARSRQRVASASAVV